MDTFNEKVHSPSRYSMVQQQGPDVSRFRQFLNFLGCILVLPIYSIITGYTRHPLTLDVLLTIFAAEYNRYTNETRRQQLQGSSRTVQDPEKATYLPTATDRATECMAAIVGYREDPELFARALDSYKLASECRFVLVGVDGDDVPDMEMVRVFQNV
jgi:hyaluronan synthase